MQIRIELQEKGDDFLALELARFLCDFQHLTTFAVTLADEHLRSDLDVFEAIQTKYDFMIVADVEGPLGRGLVDSRLFVKEVSLSSPLKILVGFFFRGSATTLRRVLEILTRLIMIDLMRERAAIVNASLRQDVIGKLLRNYEDGLRIAQRISDPQRRAAFEENLTSALVPFVDGRYPGIERMEIIDPNEPR